MGSSEQSPGLWQGSNSPGDPRFVKLHSMNSHYSRNSYNKPVSWTWSRRRRLMPWQHLGWMPGWPISLAVQWATTTVEDDKVAGESDLSKYDEVVITKDTETIDALSSHVIPAKTGTDYTSERINVDDWSPMCLRMGPYPRLWQYKMLIQSCIRATKNVAVVVRNSTAYPQTLRKKIPVVKAVVATRVPEPLAPGLVQWKSWMSQSWLWSKDRRSCLRSWTWVDWNPGHQSWQILPNLS